MALARLFAPRGVAFVGATPDPERYNGRVLQYGLREGFAGQVYAVNPKYGECFGLPCYRQLTDIPGPVDVVVILVGPARVPELIEQCQAKGVAYAVALGELAEPGAGQAVRLAALRRQIAASGPRIVGPVCVGVIAPHAGLAMTMSSGMFAGSVPKGGIGLVSQSGGILSAVLDRAHQFGSGFSALVSSGAEWDLNVCDFVEHLIDDPATDCISIYAEKLVDPPRLFRLAAAARDADKPILLLKGGSSEAGARVALTHSGAIASRAAVAQAAFRRHGIVQVHDLDDLHMSATLLGRARVAPQHGVAAVSQSGGYCTVVADALSRAGVPVAPVSAATAARILAETPVTHVGNPHDSATGPPGNNAVNTRAALLAFQDDPEIGVTLYAETMYMYQNEGFSRQRDVARYGRKPHLVCWQGGRATEPVIQALRDDGVMAFDSLQATVSALACLYRHAGLPAAIPPEPDADGDSVRDLPERGGVLGQALTTELLRRFDVGLVEERRADGPAAAAMIAESLGYPVALKGVVQGVAHKTERGLVRLDLADADAVFAAARGMAAQCGGALAHFVVQPMLRGGIEFAVGVQTDPALGPAVLLGLGGIFIEALGAPAIEMAPLDRPAAEAMLRAVDRKDMLGGYRTGRRLAREALLRTLLAVGRLAWALRDRIDSLDLNPVIVTADDAVAVDAVIALRPATPERRA